MIRGEVGGEEYVLEILADEDIPAPAEEVAEEIAEVFWEKPRAGKVGFWAEAEKGKCYQKATMQPYRSLDLPDLK